jgi:hypothetical protein
MRTTWQSHEIASPPAADRNDSFYVCLYNVFHYSLNPTETLSMKTGGGQDFLNRCILFLPGFLITGNINFRFKKGVKNDGKKGNLSQLWWRN